MHDKLANAIRFLSIDMVQKAKSGHPGMPMGMADIATVLFKDFLKFNPEDPNWFDRDRFVLSNGHGSALLYSILHLTGYKDMTMEELKNFRQLGSKTAGHPEYGLASGIETTTGPLGQGIANAVGMALAERIQNAKFGDELVNHKTYAFCGDGCLMEGISQEAISFAGHIGLKNLIVMFDDNDISIDGSTSLSTSEDHIKRFEAVHWNTKTIDGHNPEEIHEALKWAQNSDRPVLIACKTTIGFGSPSKAGTAATHGAPLGDEEIAGTREALNWEHEPFIVPDEILNEWRSFADRNADEYNTWQKRFEKDGTELANWQAGMVSKKVTDALLKAKKDFCEEPAKAATRKSSGQILNVIADLMPNLVGGSADLTGSNLTKADSQEPITKDNYAGNYIYYGVREHGMAAIMNGMTLHGGIIPYSGTFLSFTDYCRPALRLAALMGIRTVSVMTHDSIGLGEDGPTHQPIEHLASLRAMPNMHVYRPCDVVETLECWDLALHSMGTPSVLALTRQGVEQVRNEYAEENKCSRGAYILKEAENEFKVTIFASGSEVEIAAESAKELEAKGIGTRIVSVPCMDIFFEQDMEYKVSIMCNNSLKVAIEAASGFGWERLIGPHGIFIGMDSFGESAPAPDLYKHFGITSENTVERVLEVLESKKAS